VSHAEGSKTWRSRGSPYGEHSDLTAAAGSRPTGPGSAYTDPPTDWAPPRRAGAAEEEEIAVRGKHERDDDVTPVTTAHRRFGGFDLLAALGGMLAALGLTVLLAGIAGATGTVSYQRDTDIADVSSAGLITGMAILLVAFFVGGWVAGRMARYDGILNGTLSALLFVLLAGGLSALGTWADAKYDFFNDVRLPQWFSGPDTAAAMITAAVGIAVVLLAGALGGGAGTRYHRRADALIATRGDEVRMAERMPTTTTPAVRDDRIVRGEADVSVHSSEEEARRAIR
jgi:hypothetical protein